MLREVALYLGYTVLALGAGLGAVAAVCGLAWWIAQKILEQWTTMDLFWHTCARIATERSDEKTRQSAQLDYEAIKRRGSEQ